MAYFQPTLHCSRCMESSHLTMFHSYETNMSITHSVVRFVQLYLRQFNMFGGLVKFGELRIPKSVLGLTIRDITSSSVSTPKCNKLTSRISANLSSVIGILEIRKVYSAPTTSISRSITCTSNLNDNLYYRTGKRTHHYDLLKIHLEPHFPVRLENNRHKHRTTHSPATCGRTHRCF